MSNLKEQISKSFNKNIINVNGHEYVSVDVFQTAVSEVAVLESLLGALVLRMKKDVAISEKEAMDYMCKNNEMVNIEFENGDYKIKIKDNN